MSNIPFAVALVIASTMPLAGSAAEPKKDQWNVAIVVHDRVELLDFSGPGEVFAAAAGRRAFRVYTVGETTQPIRSQGFLNVTPEFSVANCPKPDIVVIPGGDTGVLLRSPAVMKWVKTAASEADIMFSVCTGVFVLADAALLDGKEATTHASAISKLKGYARIKVRPDRRVIDNGKTVTAAGVSAGIDGALHIVSRLCGLEAARLTAKYMEYRWEPEAANASGKAVPPEVAAWFAGNWSAAAKGYQEVVAQRPGDGVVHYRLSRVLALMGESDKAIFALEKALGAGQTVDSEGARLQRDFDSLRNDPRFGAIFRKHADQSKVTIPWSDEPGEKLVVTGFVRDAGGKPVPDALVYVYHTDARGNYSSSDKDSRSPTPRLFAYMRTDPQGRYEYRTIRPASYPDTDNPQHVHYEVSAPGFRDYHGLLLFADDPLLKGEMRQRAEQSGSIPKIERDKDGVSHCAFDVALIRN